MVGPFETLKTHLINGFLVPMRVHLGQEAGHSIMLPREERVQRGQASVVIDPFVTGSHAATLATIGVVFVNGKNALVIKLKKAALQ